MGYLQLALPKKNWYFEKAGNGCIFLWRPFFIVFFYRGETFNSGVNFVLNIGRTFNWSKGKASSECPGLGGPYEDMYCAILDYLCVALDRQLIANTAKKTNSRLCELSPRYWLKRPNGPDNMHHWAVCVIGDWRCLGSTSWTLSSTATATAVHPMYWIRWFW